LVEPAVFLVSVFGLVGNLAVILTPPMVAIVIASFQVKVAFLFVKV
jgi:hypothetical protein